MTAKEIRTELQAQLKFARANVKTAHERDERAAMHYWEGYRDSLLAVMCKDVLFSVKGEAA